MEDIRVCDFIEMNENPSEEYQTEEGMIKLILIDLHMLKRMHPFMKQSLSAAIKIIEKVGGY